MSNKWIIVIGFVIIILCMVLSSNQIKQNDAYIKGNPQIAVNTQADKEKLNEYLKDYMPDTNTVSDDGEEGPDSIKFGIGAVIDDENNTVRLNYDDFYILYTHDGTNVTSATAYFEFNNNEDAKLAIKTIDYSELAEDVESVSVVDNKIEIKFGRKVYDAMSTSILKSTAASFQLIGSKSEQ